MFSYMQKVRIYKTKSDLFALIGRTKGDIVLKLQ